MSNELRTPTGFRAGTCVKLNPTTMSTGKDTAAGILLQD